MPVQEKEFKADYDGESDSLFIHEVGKKSKKTITLGDWLFDFRNGKAIGVELFDFSKTVSILLDKSIKPGDLEQVGRCRLSTTEIRSGVVVAWKCDVRIKDREKQPISEAIPITDRRMVKEILSY